MTTYYVDFTNGLDANNGLGPDASHATNKPWKTMAKVLGAAGIASGDTCYLAPGAFREVVTVAMTSAVAETSIIGDPGNAQGFKTGAGVRVAPGDVIWTAYLTNDTSAPSASTLLTLAGRDFLTFQYITFVGGSNAAPSIINANTTPGANNITIRDCAFLNVTVAQTINYIGVVDVASNWLIDRCAFMTMNNAAVNITLPTSASADYDSNFVVQNCFFLQSASNAVNVTASGADAFKGGGVDVLNCSIICANGSLLNANNANLSTSIPCTAYNNLIVNGAGASLSANTAGQVLADYNRRIGTATTTNITPGANDVSGNNSAPLVEIGQALLMGRIVRPLFMPMAGSPLLNFGNQAGAPSVDFWNRPRPAGGLLNATGYLERHDTATQETTTVRTGSSALAITGPGDHDFEVPVDAGAATVSIYGRYDANHAATNKPQMRIVNGEECGVTSATATMTAAANTWEQLSLNITPTRAGIITVRLTSRSAAANGIAFFDDFTVA